MPFLCHEELSCHLGLKPLEVKRLRKALEAASEAAAAAPEAPAEVARREL